MNTDKVVVLNVDDYEAGRYATTRVLRQAGFEVVEAASGEEALALAGELPDLVVLDVNLPDMDGFEVCRRIKSEPATAAVPVLYLSAAYRSPEHRVQGLELGAEAYLTQPVDPRELVAMVNAIVRTRHVREAVEESEERFRSLMTATTDIIWTTGPAGEFVDDQPDWREFTGQSVEEARGAGWLDAVHPDDREPLRARWETALAERSFYDAEARFRRHDGEYRQMLVRAIPILEPDGSVREWVGAHTDVTERRLAEQALQERTTALEEANRAKADFLATMSHELRTPLNAMVGYTDLLLMGVPAPIPEAALAHVERIRSAAFHLSQLIEEVLTHARIEAGRDQLHLETTDLAELLDDVVTLVEPLARQKGLRFVVDRDAAPARVDTDPRKVRQVLLNLLGNAVKFTEEGEIGLAVRATDTDLLLRVRDTGIGIAPAHQEKIFEPFWQVDGTRTRVAGGTGLGLGVVRQIAQRLGGDVSVRSREGAGSEFTVTLPLRPRPEGG